MLQGWVVIAFALGYIGLLFVVASYGDQTRRFRPGGYWRQFIYPLSLAIYCTSWTFFGSVGSASRSSFDFLTIYLGPILVIGLCSPLIMRIVRLAKAQNITSIADFIAARYGKAQTVAATVTLIASVDRPIMESLTAALRVAIVAAFVLSFAAFIYREKTTASPILDLSLFRIRMFTLSSLALLLVGIAQVMIGFLLPFYLQEVLHLKPSFIGLLFVSAPIFTVSLSPWVGWAVDKVGPRLPATIGISFLAGAGFFGSYLRADSHWLAAVGVLALWGLATALFFTSNHTAMITSVPAQHRGVATGAIYVMFGLGTTFGVSLGTMLLTTAFRHYSGDPLATPTATTPETFVRSMNFSFLVGGAMALAAMGCSALRGERAAQAH